MEIALGRRIRNGEVVHHKDRNKLNNDLANLELMTRAEHNSLHAADLSPVERIARATKASLAAKAKLCCA